MITDLRPYPVYKDSGVPWLGTVPEQWELRRLKYLLQECDVRSTDGHEQLLRVSQFTGVTERKPANGGDLPDTRAESLVGYKRVEPNDLVINIMLAWNGSMGVSPFAGIASPAYCVYRFGPAAQPWYFHHLLRSPVYKARIKAASTGVVESRLRLYTDDLYRLEALLPSLSEQTAIVRFLDHADRRIRRYIRAKQKLIKLLDEQKQAITHRFVARGLVPNVRLKPSGVDWLGEIPENFKRAKLGRLCSSIRDGTHNPPPALPGVHRLLSVRNIIKSHFVTRADDRTMTPPAFTELQRSYTVQAGDVVLALVGATTGKSAVVEPMENVTVQRSIGILRPKQTLLDSHYLHLLISSEIVQSQIREIMNKYAAQPGIYLADVSALQVIYPELNVQQAIVVAQRKETAQLNASIEICHHEIELLREYRTRLIADVVTGKLDVREVAAKLPDETEEPEPVDDAEALAEEDTTNEDLDAALEEAEA